MGSHVRQRRMQITPQLFDKLPHGIIDVSYQGITAGLNHCQKIIRCPARLLGLALSNQGNLTIALRIPCSDSLIDLVPIRWKSRDRYYLPHPATFWRELISTKRTRASVTRLARGLED